MSKPTLIFAPGAWYPPTIFNPIIEQLADYTCHTITFPSIERPSSVSNLDPDIAAVRAVAEQEVTAGHEVIIIAHDWAGLPVSSALKGLGRAERESLHESGGVLRLIFIAAFIPRLGESLISAFGGVAPPWYVHDEPNGTVTTSDPYLLFFQDVPNGEELVKQLKPHAWVAQTCNATDEAYLSIPCAYLMTENDCALPFPVQQALVKRAERQGARIESETIKAGHTPWLAVPDQVLAFIKKHAGELS